MLGPLTVKVMGESLYWGIGVGNRVKVSYITGARRFFSPGGTLATFVGLCFGGI